MSANDKDRITAFSKDPFVFTLIGGKHCPEGGGPEDTDDESEDTHLLWDERLRHPLLQASVEDIRRLGIHTPIKVRRNGPKLEVVFGRQRVRIARVLAREGVDIKVPYLVVSAKNDKELMQLLISENEHRTEDTFANKAEKCRRLMKYGGTIDDARVAFRFDSDLSVKNLLRYFDMAPEVQRALNSGKLGSSAAVELSKLTREQQTEQLQKAMAEGNGHVKAAAAARIVRTQQGKKAGTAARIPARVAKKILAHERAEKIGGGGRFAEGFAAGVRVMIGDLPVEKVAELKGILKELFVVQD